METVSAILFDTALGRCGLAWNAKGLVAVSFPEGSDEQILARLSKRSEHVSPVATPPANIARLVDDIARLFDGEKRDLAYAALDMEGIGDFDRDLYALTVKIEPGETKTYGELARALGDVAFSQRVGQSLGRNPWPIVVPCHRVLGAGGKMTGFSAPGGVEAKRRLLKIEGAIGPDLFD